MRGLAPLAAGAGAGAAEAVSHGSPPAAVPDSSARASNTVRREGMRASMRKRLEPIPGGWERPVRPLAAEWRHAFVKKPWPASTTGQDWKHYDTLRPRP